MPIIFSPARWALLPAVVFLFVLPFSSLGGLRLTALVLTGLMVWLGRDALHVPRLPIKGALLLWLAVALISLAWALDPRYSFQEIRVEIGYGVIAFLVFFSLTRSWAEGRLWLRTLVASMLVINGIALGHYFDSKGTFSPGQHGDIGRYSTYLITMLAPTLFLATREPPRKFSSYLAWLLVLLILIGGYMTENRMFWLAAIVMVAFFTVLYVVGHERPPLVVKRALLLCGASIAVLTLLFGAVLEQRTAPFSDESKSGELSAWPDQRPQIWRHAIHEIAERPFSGVGFGRAADHQAFRDIPPSGFIWHAHNLFLDYMLQMGIWGAVALGVLFLAVGREFWELYRSGDRMLRLIGIAGLTLLVGTVMKNMTDDFFLRQNALLFWSLAGAGLGYGLRRKQELTKLETAATAGLA